MDSCACLTYEEHLSKPPHGEPEKRAFVSATRPAPTAEESSVTFVWERPDDETAVFSIEWGPTDLGNPVTEELKRFNYDEHGTSGMEAARSALQLAAVAIGARWSER